MRTFATIFVFCIVTLSVKSQEWAPVGATWHYTEEIFMPTTIDKDYIKFESVKDTMYQGMLCRKITKRHDNSCTDRPAVEYMYSQNDKVYFWDEHFNSFQVLYDFSAGQGDSWVILLTDMNPADVDSLIVKVDSTNTAIINGVQLKRLYVTYDFRNETISPYTYRGVLIQSLGDMIFMFNYFQEWAFGCDGNFASGLRCYEDAAIGLFETGIAPSCTYVHQLTGINPEPGSAQRFSLFPNPADQVITIESSITGPVWYTIADLTGRKVKSGLITGSVIETGNLGPGIYHIFFFQNGERFPEIKKLVIRRHT